MRNMFSDIHNYREKKYFNTHTNGSLYVMGKTYNMELYAYARVDTLDTDIYTLDYYQKGKTKEIVEMFKKQATYINDISIKDDDKLVMLSTCEDDVSTERNVLLFRINNQ